MTKHAGLLLGDLLDDATLGLELRTGSDGARRRAVLGAAVVEVASPARWIARQWVLLTAGVRLEGASDAALRALVAECDGAGVAALAFGVGPVFDELPAALLDEGRARGYPIVAVPFGTPFRDVVRFVDAAIMGDEAPLYRRLSSLQRFVVDALGDPEPERAVVERLARFLDAGVAVLAPGGAVELASGNPPVEALWPAIAGRPPGLLDAEGGGWHAVATPLASAAGEPPRWLLLAGRHEGFIGTLARRAAEMTAPLLVALDRLHAVARSQELAVRGALLDEVLRPAPAGDMPSLAARAAAFGLDFGAAARMIAARDDTADPAVLRHELAELLARGRAPHLLTRRGPCAVALVQGGEPALRGALDELAAAHASAVLGLGRPVAGIAQAPASLRDAELACERATPERRVIAFEELDLGTLLLSEAAPERLGPKVEALVSVLREHPPLKAALVAYFDHDLDAVAAAAALHLHPNSLRYRLGRVEELLECSLKHPATIAELHIALLAERRTDVSMS